jgi:hypothetical protein
MWLYLQNPFLNATEKSFLKAMGISTYHDAALAAAKSDPGILECYNYYHPHHLNYKTAYDDWIEQGGEQQSETLNLNQLLLLLSNKIRQWDIKIQNQYPSDTPAYKRLLPNRRQPFQNGTQLERVHAVEVLNLAIGTDESLTSVKTEVNNFNTLLQAAYESQKGDVSSTRTDSSTLDGFRVKMCEAQYADLGSLIKKFAATPERVGAFFDLQAIRHAEQTSFTGILKAGEVFTILKHTFAADDELVLINHGTEPLKFYLGSAKNMQPGAVFVTVNSGAKTIVASELGDLKNTFLTVLNTDTAHEAEFILELE